MLMGEQMSGTGRNLRRSNDKDGGYGPRRTKLSRSERSLRGRPTSYPAHGMILLHQHPLDRGVCTPEALHFVAHVQDEEVGCS